MTPSTLALSLLNCNPLVANDPVLSTSLTSLATQVLHMEHLIQAYMVRTTAHIRLCALVTLPVAHRSASSSLLRSLLIAP